MPWPFDREYMQLALVAGVVMGASAPLIGAFLVQRRMALLGDGIGHLAFAGVGVGLLVGVWPVWAALVVGVAGAVGIERLRARGRVPGDLALALFFYSGIAAGAVLAGRAGSLNGSLLSYLFGEILTVAPGDVWVVVGLGVAIVAIVGVAGRALFAVVLDEESARVAGLPVDALNALLAALAAVTVVGAMRVVGVLLVAALMVLPVATAQVLARSFRATLWLAAATGVSAVVVGLAAARAWALAPGGAIVLTAAVAFAGASLAVGLRRPPSSAPVAGDAVWVDREGGG